MIPFFMFFRIHKYARYQTGIITPPGFPSEPTQLPHSSSPQTGEWLSGAFIYTHCPTLLSTHVIVTLPCELHGAFCQHTPTHTHVRTHNSTFTQFGLYYPVHVITPQSGSKQTRRHPPSSWPEVYILPKASCLPNGVLNAGAWERGEAVVAAASLFRPCP